MDTLDKIINQCDEGKLSWAMVGSTIAFNKFFPSMYTSKNIILNLHFGAFEDKYIITIVPSNYYVCILTYNASNNHCETVNLTPSDDKIEQLLLYVEDFTGMAMHEFDNGVLL